MGRTKNYSKAILPDRPMADVILLNKPYGVLCQFSASAGRRTLKWAWIEAAHGAPLPKLTARAGKAIDRFLTPELRHNQARDAMADLGWAGELAQAVLDWFQAAAADRAPGPEALEPAAAALESKRQDIGSLVSPAACELDAMRSELREVRAKLDVEAAERRRERTHLEAELRAFYAALDKLDEAVGAS